MFRLLGPGSDGSRPAVGANRRSAVVACGLARLAVQRLWVIAVGLPGSAASAVRFGQARLCRPHSAAAAARPDTGPLHALGNTRSERLPMVGAAAMLRGSSRCRVCDCRRPVIRYFSARPAAWRDVDPLPRETGLAWDQTGLDSPNYPAARSRSQASGMRPVVLGSDSGRSSGA